MYRCELGIKENLTLHVKFRLPIYACYQMEECNDIPCHKPLRYSTDRPDCLSENATSLPTDSRKLYTLIFYAFFCTVYFAFW
jgi:hypothetical protein